MEDEMKEKTIKILRISEAQNHRCAYCGFDMWLPWTEHQTCTMAYFLKRAKSVGAAHRARKWRAATSEHVVPKCNGGANSHLNIVAACRWCNHYRAAHSAEYALKHIQMRLADGTHPHCRFEERGTMAHCGEFLPSESAA